MGIILAPDPGARVSAAVVGVLAAEGIELGGQPPAYRSPWRTTALAEGVDRLPAAAARGYSAFSPRSTRGAIRA